MSELSAPIGAMMRAATLVGPEDSIEVAARLMREEGVSLLPVGNGPFLLGVVTERGLVRALGEGLALHESIEGLMEAPSVVMPYASGAEALRRFERSPHDSLVVVDDQGRIMGVLTPSDLFPKHEAPPRPPMIGGMATPFGVYLTTGTVRAGASDLALVTTGMSLFVLFFAANAGALALAQFMVDQGLPERTGSAILDLLAVTFFLAGMRSFPLAGIHAAEHQVVHAIERGEELRPEIVRRMPRVHPRCGTNLAVGATLFLAIFSSEWIRDPQLRLLLAFMVTLFFWRPLGSMAQYWVTTRPPSEKHIAMGIAAGTELLARHARSGRMMPTPLMRLWNSGMFHVMAGSTLAYAVVAGLSHLFKIPLPM